MGKKGEQVYTYVLEDIKEGLYKIGRSSRLQTRFASLCEIGVTEPVMVISGDMEQALHKRFKDVRTNHPDETKSGFTEYFKKGGVLSEFVDGNRRGEVPFISPTSLIKGMTKSKSLRVMDMGTMWTIGNFRFGDYRLGVAVLDLLDYIDDGYNGIEVKSVEVSHYDRKLAVTKSLYDELVGSDRQVLVTEAPFGGEYTSVAADMDGEVVYLNIK